MVYKITKELKDFIYVNLLLELKDYNDHIYYNKYGHIILEKDHHLIKDILYWFSSGELVNIKKFQTIAPVALYWIKTGKIELCLHIAIISAPLGGLVYKMNTFQLSSELKSILLNKLLRVKIHKDYNFLIDIHLIMTSKIYRIELFEWYESFERINIGNFRGVRIQSIVFRDNKEITIRFGVNRFLTRPNWCSWFIKDD